MSNGYVYEHIVTPRDITVHGIAYDLSFLEWACTARERMIVERLGPERFQGPWFLVGEVHMRYLYPALLGDRVQVQVSVTDVEGQKGRARLVFHIINQVTGQVLASGHQVIFFSDPETGRRIEIPPEFVALAQEQP